MNVRLMMTALCGIAAPSLLSSAEGPPSRFALAAEAGTTGIGASLWVTATPKFSFSFSYAGLSLDHDYDTVEADYDGTLRGRHGMALLRWHPTGGGFNVSAGGAYSENEVTMIGVPNSGDFDLDGELYPADLVGTLVGKADWGGSFAPYIGIGWAKRSANGGWGGFFDVGAFALESPETSLRATGAIAGEAAFQEALQREEARVNEELDEFSWYPVIKLGLMYRF